jgi:hypothetical protein
MYFFEPIKHEYSCDHEPPETLSKAISVSGVLEKYQEQFDEKFWSRYKGWEMILFPLEKNKQQRKAKFKNLLKRRLGLTGYKDENLFSTLEQTYPELKDIVKNEMSSSIKKSWKAYNKERSDIGDAYHNQKESKSFSRGIEFNPFDEQEYPVIKHYFWKKGIKQQETIKDLKRGYYPELIVNHKWLFGQIDRPWFTDDKKFFIRDFKTNKKKLDTPHPFQNLKYPVDHLQDTTLNYYSLQLSLYAWILEQKGYKLYDENSLAIDYYNQTLPVKYLKKEIEDILNHYTLFHL